jgi:hypothetical protein
MHFSVKQLPLMVPCAVLSFKFSIPNLFLVFLAEGEGQRPAKNNVKTPSTRIFCAILTETLS